MPQPLVRDPKNNQAFPHWSRDGRYLVYYLFDPNATPENRDLWYLNMIGDRVPQPFLTTAANEFAPRLSPDSRYVVYISDKTGHNEVYVRPFPEGEGEWPISVNGGAYPQWNGDGSELYYVQNNTLMAVDIKTHPAFDAGTPNPLFTGDQVGSLLADERFGNLASYYAAAQDGQRFVIVQNTVVGDADVVVVQNWIREFPGRE